MEKQNLPPFEEIDHTADLCLRVFGWDLQQLFVHAAQGMFHLMQCKPSGKATPIFHVVALEAYDLETLLVDWLGELLYLSEFKKVCYTTFEIDQLEPTHLRATVRGLTNHVAQKGIKAVTFSDLEVTRQADGHYETRITFDV